MTHQRLRLTCLFLALAWAQAASAQESTGSSSTGSATGSGTSASGASPAAGSSPAPAPATGGGTSPPAGGSVFNPGAESGAASSFGTGTPSGSTPTPAPAESPGPAKPLDAGPTTFSISTGYGRAPEVFVSGEGRLTRPRFETRVSASIGFDDNLFQTPTDAQAVPDTVIRQQVTAGTEAQIVLVPVRNTGPQLLTFGPAPRGQQVRQVIIPGEDPQFEEIVIPGSPAPKRQSSAVSRETLSVEAQTATRRSLFTLDLNVNSDYYWNRKGKKAEYNGSLAIRYLHRFSPRLQLTASVNASYLSQPDLSQINTPTNTGNGNYLVVSSKFDLLYRWAPRFTTVTSLSYNRLSFEEKLREISDYSSATLGMELRYLWSPKLTAVVEGRVSQISYPNNPTLDSSSYFALIGVDLALSRRAAATVRLGEGIRIFDEGGGKASAPYLETTLNYQLSRASVLSWSNRFGFEEPPDPNTEVLVFRSGLAVTHVFGPRLRASLSVNGIHRSTKNDLTKTETGEDTLDSALTFNYTLTRRWNLNLNYTYTTVFFDPNEESNYFRNRLFAGFDYEF